MRESEDKEAIASLSPDAVLFVELEGLVGDDGVSSALDDAGIPHSTLSFAPGARALFEEAEELLGTEVSDTVLEVFSRIDGLIGGSSGISDADRFSVLSIFGEHGEFCYGEQSPMSAMVGAAAGKLLDRQLGRTGTFQLDTQTAMLDCDPDIVVLCDSESYYSFSTPVSIVDDRAGSVWQSSDAARLECVFPGLIDSRLWLASLSPLSLLSLGSAWLSDSLYPNEAGIDLSSLVSSYFEQLYGRAAGDRSDVGDPLHDSFRGTTKTQLDARRDQLEAEQAGRVAQLRDEMEEANTYTEEELAQYAEEGEKLKERWEEQQRRNRELLGLE